MTSERVSFLGQIRSNTVNASSSWSSPPSGGWAGKLVASSSGSSPPPPPRLLPPFLPPPLPDLPPALPARLSFPAPFFLLAELLSSSSSSLSCVASVGCWAGVEAGGGGAAAGCERKGICSRTLARICRWADDFIGALPATCSFGVKLRTFDQGQVSSRWTSSSR